MEAQLRLLKATAERPCQEHRELQERVDGRGRGWRVDRSDRVDRSTSENRVGLRADALVSS